MHVLFCKSTLKKFYFNTKGIVKLVGEAVAEELHKYKTSLTVLGISTYGSIKYREKLVNLVI